MTQKAAAGVKELRLGLVCYGGVSLAIYMHGVTKEIHRAVRASVLGEREIKSADDAKSEQAYRALLADLAEEQGVQTRIVIDQIAGSSAGGINGIFLAKALAHDLSQDRLRDLWFEHGDLGKIIRKTKFRGKWFVKRLLMRLLPAGEGGVPSKDTWAEIALAAVALGRRADSLFDGNEMAARIFDAIHGMESVPPSDVESLMPEGHPLELTVTVTDHYGYPRFLPLTDPSILTESQHRHLLEFRYDAGKDHFAGTVDDALTLAARATSSLPVGFQTVNPKTFPDILPKGESSLERLEPFFRDYALSDAKPARAYLVDGGVLDNKPFGPVIKGISERRADNEVDRYLVYLEPDPGSAKDPKEDAPHPLSGLLAALSGLPRSEGILDELHDVLVRNQQVLAVRDVIETNWKPVDDLVRPELGDLDQLPTDPNSEVLQGWNTSIHKIAASVNDLGEAAYVRLKISSAVQSFSRAACLACEYTDSSNHAFLVQAVLREWAARRGLFKQEPKPTTSQREFVATFDLAFAERRLMFVIAGISWLYRDVGKPGYPTREQLDAVKKRVYDSVLELRRLSSGNGFSDEVLEGISTCFGEKVVTDYLKKHKFDFEKFLSAYADDLDDLNRRLKTYLDDERPKIAPALYRDLIKLTTGWSSKVRGDLLIRYLGFPIWDSLLYPVQALSSVAERDEIRVMRLSPNDSNQIHPAAKKSKVEGAKLGHAFAFFSREARENDYLWGRLDAAERMVRLLLTTYETKEEDGRTIHERVSGENHERYDEWCKKVFLAVLEEDAEALPNAQPVVEHVRKEIDEVGKPK